MYDSIFKAITNYRRRFDYKIKIGKKYHRLFSFKLVGGVASGDPTLTTFGNTLRVIHYYKFIFSKSGIEHFRMFVGGDDFYVVMLRKDVQIFTTTARKYFCDKPDGVHGLG